MNELFADGNEFNLHRLLSEVAGNDININTNDLMKLDSMKFPDSRTLSEFVSSFDGNFFLNIYESGKFHNYK